MRYATQMEKGDPKLIEVGRIYYSYLFIYSDNNLPF